MSPNWAVNMCCGVLNVPIVTFFLTVLVGLMPYNYICVTTGVILTKLTSINDVFTWTTLMQMSGIAMMAIVPAVIHRYIDLLTTWLDPADMGAWLLS